MGETIVALGTRQALIAPAEMARSFSGYFVTTQGIIDRVDTYTEAMDIAIDYVFVK